ncbi:MAG: aminodeoxychorismate synthase component I, partial [Dokdonella sp.]
MTHVVKEIAGVRDLLGLAAARPGRYPGLLESAARGSARARHDILFAFPERELRLAAGIVRDEHGASHGDRFLDALDDAWRAERVARSDDGLPFHGGWLLYLGYELAAEIEPCLHLPEPRGAALPTALALRCPAAIIVDHERARTLLVAETGREALLGELDADLAAVASFEGSLRGRTQIEEDDPKAFLDGVARVREHLRDGDVFQVNLSRAWRARCTPAPRPVDVHAALRRANPA